VKIKETLFFPYIFLMGEWAYSHGQNPGKLWDSAKKNLGGRSYPWILLIHQVSLRFNIFTTNTPLVSGNSDSDNEEPIT
jgi:hypothetical protein